jgi:hypothetical protein
MKSKYVTNGKTYYIETYNVGQSFGTSARVRRGSWSQTTDQTYPLGMHHAAASAAERLADKREGVL